VRKVHRDARILCLPPLPLRVERQMPLARTHDNRGSCHVQERLPHVLLTTTYKPSKVMFQFLADLLEASHSMACPLRRRVILDPAPSLHC
jgi:hypothetical protein